jgi:hypothetical protein
MDVYCIPQFKSEFEKLSSKKHYSNLQKELINHFIDKKITDLESGTRLNGSDSNPYIKKRLSGSGGYRVYYYLITSSGDVYLMYVHPKTGPDGKENITNEQKKIFYKEVLAAIKSNHLYRVTSNVERTTLQFTLMKEVNVNT